MIAAGADTLSRVKTLRLPDNSPFWQHFTQGVLLCSGTSYTKKVKKSIPHLRIFKKISIPLVKMPQIATKKALCPLAFCALLLYNETILGKEGQLWAK